MQRQKTPSGNFLVTSFTSSTGPNSDNNNNMPSAAAATAAAYDPMSQVLATFSCPRDCHLFEASYREMINCPFGHSPNTGQQLKKVPPAACIRSLLGECEKTVKKRVVDLVSGATISNSQSSGSSSSLNKLTHATDILTIAQCSQGVHFSVEQLVDLEHFYEQNTAANLARIQAAEEGETTGGEVTIAATTSFNGNNNSQQQQAPPQLPSSSASVSSFSSQQSRASVAIRERECAICLLSMAEGQPLGMLSQCVHVFCASCLINWFRSPPPPSLANLNRLQTCPVCRATSSFVLPWPRPLTGRAEKWTIFKLQHDALHMVSEQLAPHEGDEEEDGEGGEDGNEEGGGEEEDMEEEEEDNSGDTSNDEEHIDREGEGDSSSSSDEDI